MHFMALGRGLESLLVGNNPKQIEATAQKIANEYLKQKQEAEKALVKAGIKAEDPNLPELIQAVLEAVKPDPAKV